MNKITLILAVAVLLTGCAHQVVVKVPSEEQLKSASYGEKPDMAQVEKSIKAWSVDALKDPDSMQLMDISKSSNQGWLPLCLRPYENECFERNFYFGHIVTARINAKNSNGGYVGYNDYSFLFHGNKVVFHLPPGAIR